MTKYFQMVMVDSPMLLLVLSMPSYIDGDGHENDNFDDDFGHHGDRDDSSDDDSGGY